MNPLLPSCSSPSPRLLARIGRTALVATLAVATVPAQVTIPGPACPGDFVRNGGFYNGVVFGSMPSVSVANWSMISGTPSVVSDGALAPGCLMMWGNQVDGESVKQQIDGGFVYGRTYEISFSYRWLPDANNPQRPPHVSFRLGASTGVPTLYPPMDPNLQTICTTPLQASTTWQRYTTAWYAMLTGPWLTINPENEFNVSHGDYVSWGEIDDICIRPVAVCPNNVLENGHFTDGLAYGNLGAPGGGTVTGWSRLTGTPQVSLEGSNTIGCIQMWGNQAVGESVQQLVPGGFRRNHTYRVSFAYRWILDPLQPQRPAYVHFRLCAANSPTEYPPVAIAAGRPNYREITSSADFSYSWWRIHSDLWTADADYASLTINPENDFNTTNGDFVSWGQIDDICIQDVSFPGVGRPFGTSCNLLRLDLGTAPVIGTTFTLLTSDVPSGATAGLQILSLAFVQSGIDLTGMGMPGCFLYVNTFDLVQPFVAAGATALVPFAIPNDQALLGAAVYGQSLALAPGINSLGAISSNGLHLAIGDY